MKKVNKERIEFQMYGYKGRLNRTNKAYNELKERYKKLEQYYQNALDNCFELDNENTSLKMQIEKLKELVSIDDKKIENENDITKFYLYKRIERIDEKYNEILEKLKEM